MQPGSQEAFRHKPASDDGTAQGIPAVAPVPSVIKATEGQYCTLEVGNQYPLTQDSTAEVPAASGWRTTKGLGLYVLSTLLLSIQAASAKVLGKFLTRCNNTTPFTPSKQSCPGRHGLDTSVMILFRSVAILLGPILPLVWSKPVSPWGIRCDAACSKHFFMHALCRTDI